jgi:predicted transposase/invertase (TIGR01784 family)
VKTDTLFYNIFQEYPSIFFELIGKEPTLANNYKFTSIEVKQIAFRLDGLFLPTTNTSEQPFYIVEVQFQPDEELYYRLFAELCIYLRREKPPYPWNAVIIYPTRAIEREETLQFGEILNLQRVKRIYLDELDPSDSNLGVGIVKLVVEPETTAPQKARTLIEQAKQQTSDADIQRGIIDLIETIILYKLPQKSREEIENMLGLNDLKQTRVYQEALAEGKEEGLLQGKLEAAQRMRQAGLTLELISQYLDLPLDVVKKAVQQS